MNQKVVLEEQFFVQNFSLIFSFSISISKSGGLNFMEFGNLIDCINTPLSLACSTIYISFF